MISNYPWYNEESRAVMSAGYLQENETIDDAIARIATRASEILNMPAIAAKIASCIAKSWFVPSSPVWSNFGSERGLPISCNGTFLEDNIESILHAQAEIGMMTKLGAGTSAYFGSLREKGAAISGGGTSCGPLSFMEFFDKTMDIISQGGVRRGSMAAYMDIEHPDIEEFLSIKDIGSPIQSVGFHTGVCVSDDFMEKLLAQNMRAMQIWARLLRSRQEKGEPYIFFSGNANGVTKPKCYDGQTIHASNLCSEIFLISSASESFVCNLTAMNGAKYHEWKDTDAVRTCVFLLDAVMTDYINKTQNLPFMGRAHRFAKNHRALGVGLCGLHSLFQQSGISFESRQAKDLNIQLFSNLKEKTYEASMELRDIIGPPLGYPDLDRRNTTLLAVAPNTSSSSIMGQISPGIEPFNSNYFTVELAKGNFTRKNKELAKALESHGKNDSATWYSILNSGGSVQHLNFLSPQIRSVFKTFKEINQNVIIELAADRQKFIDQGQSLNTNIPPDMELKEVNALIIKAWKLGLKALYYQRSESVSKKLFKINCVGCDG